MHLNGGYSNPTGPAIQVLGNIFALSFYVQDFNVRPLHGGMQRYGLVLSQDSSTTLVMRCAMDMKKGSDGLTVDIG